MFSGHKPAQTNTRNGDDAEVIHSPDGKSTRTTERSKSSQNISQNDPNAAKLQKDASPANPPAMPDRSAMLEYVQRMQTIKKAQATASSLRAKAKTITDPKERQRVFQEAYAKEKEVHGESKLLQRMQSGTWQGLAGGAGIGGGISLGLGGVVGTLVGGLLSIPTVGLGALIGSGVGALHGPFIKVGGEKKKWEEASPEEVVDAIEKEQQELNNGTGAQSHDVPPQQDVPSPSRPPPRKLEIRSSSVAKPEHSAEGDAPAAPVERRKPRKIEVRKKSGTGNDATDSGYAEDG